MNTGNTASYRILELLTRHRGTAYCNREIADILVLPMSSVRRTINALRRAGRVVQGMNERHWQIA